MAEYAKDIPSELRNKSATSSAEAHQSLSATSSRSGQASSSSFRTVSTDDRRADDAFNDFSKGDDHPPVEGGSRPRRSSSIIVSSWTGEDLASRENDGQAVLDLLKSSNSLDELDESLEELSSRRHQEWQTQADNATPVDPASSHPSSKDAYPYLLNLLSLPEDQSISTYLDMTSYSDDVWGLPQSLKQDLDRAKGLDGTTEEAKKKALGRLQMLREHLQAKAAERPSHQVAFEPQDWERIWQMRLS